MIHAGHSVILVFNSFGISPVVQAEIKKADVEEHGDYEEYPQCLELPRRDRSPSFASGGGHFLCFLT